MGSFGEQWDLLACSPPPWPRQNGAAACPGAPEVFLFSVASCVMSLCVRVTVSGASAGLLRSNPQPQPCPPCPGMLRLLGCSEEEEEGPL